MGGNGDDRQRKDDAHAEDGDDDAPGQEAMLPDGVISFSLLALTMALSKESENLQHGQYRADEERGRQAAKRAGHIPAEHSRPGQDRRP